VSYKTPPQQCRLSTPSCGISRALVGERFLWSWSFHACLVREKQSTHSLEIRHKMCKYKHKQSDTNNIIVCAAYVCVSLYLCETEMETMMVTETETMTMTVTETEMETMTVRRRRRQSPNTTLIDEKITLSRHAA